MALPFNHLHINCASYFLAAVFFFLEAASSTTGGAAKNAASRFIKRPLRRDALFLWITPFSAALSNELIAFKTASFVSGSSAVKAARAWLTAVRAAPRTLRLFRRRFSFCWFRLICDLILAKVVLRKISCAADPAPAGTFLIDGDVFYMRLVDLSSKFNTEPTESTEYLLQTSRSTP